MASIPQAVTGAGVACIGVASAFYVQSDSMVKAALSGALGLALVGIGLARKSIPRGRAGYDGTKQTRFIAGSGKFEDEKDEDGVVRPVYRGEKGVLGLAMESTSKIEDSDGLVISLRESLQTTYDLIFGMSANDQLPALAACSKQHTFHDSTLPDGKPNPKPQKIDVAGEWRSLTYAEMKHQARKLGTFIRKEGIEERQKVSIWSANCVEWVMADLACAAFNWTSVSVYDTLGPDAASYIVADSGSQVLVCEEKCFKKVPDLLEDPVYCGNKGADLKIVICIGKVDDKAKEKIESKGLKVACFGDIISNTETLVKDTPPKADNILTIMYTSGTTGMPKGVMLSHVNIVATISMIDLSPALSLVNSDVHLSYLPLAHIFERQNCYGLLYKGAQIYFASQGAKLLLPDLSIIKPTLFAGVPKVYENVRDAVKRKMTGVKKTLFEAAMQAKVADLETGCGYHPMWDILVFSKTKAALGGRVRFCVTGGAPISKDTLQFVLCALGPIAQGYGCTETSAASTLTMNWDLNLGHVGPPLGTAAIRLVDVPDMNYFSGKESSYTDDKAKKAFAEKRNKFGGEIWIGGPGVSLGYYDPAEHGLKPGVPSNGMAKKTTEEFFKEGQWSWFKTGDIGTWTDAGCLRVVDRRKNMFKTSLGEYVPVEEVEKTYQDFSPFADFVFLPKETKVSYVALCVVVSDSIGPVMKWAKENGVSGSEEDVVASDKFRQALTEQFEAAAKQKKLQRFMYVAKKNLHVEYQPLGYQENWVAGVVCKNGQKEQLLTATFKARRAQLDQYFAPHFPKIYPDRPQDHILP
mmetsp:Transcript_19262/g.44975  ORF Transcript_19262/g.44975 Transcript_19262/m.44975 type:complete len:807 (+) Transcript_19262:66-2486(+)